MHRKIKLVASPHNPALLVQERCLYEIWASSIDIYRGDYHPRAKNEPLRKFSIKNSSYDLHITAHWGQP